MLLNTSKARATPTTTDGLCNLWTESSQEPMQQKPKWEENIFSFYFYMGLCTSTLSGLVSFCEHVSTSDWYTMNSVHWWASHTVTAGVFLKSLEQQRPQTRPASQGLTQRFQCMLQHPCLAINLKRYRQKYQLQN